MLPQWQLLEPDGVLLCLVMLALVNRLNISCLVLSFYSGIALYHSLICAGLP